MTLSLAQVALPCVSGALARLVSFENRNILPCQVNSRVLHCIQTVVFFTAYNVDLSSQLKAARQQADVSRQELTEYKEKAARILQVLSVQSFFSFHLKICRIL